MNGSVATVGLDLMLYSIEYKNSEKFYQWNHASCMKITDFEK
jgi:hypothetical protein